MRQAILTYCCFVLFCCLAQGLAAQGSYVKTIPLNEGGKPVKINTLYKNPQGLIYVGAVNGLYIFDGTPNFKKITLPDSVAGAAVSTVFQAKDGRLWAGFENGKIASGYGEQWQLYSPEEGTPQVAVTCFVQDAQGQIWFGTNGEGIYYIANNHLYNIDEADGLSDKNIHALSLAANGDVLAATDQGINICKVNGQQKTIKVITTAQGLPDNLVTCIVPDGKQGFWIGLQDAGYCYYNHSTQQFAASSTGWMHGQVNGLQASGGALWVATQSNGLFRQPIAAAFTNPHKPIVSFTAPVTAFVIDNEGNTWCSSSNNMVRTSGERLQLFAPLDATQFANTHALLADAAQNIWLGSNQGIIKYAPATGKSQKINIAGLGNSNVITTLYQDPTGTIWIGTMGKGVFLLDPTTGSYRPLQQLPGPANRSILFIGGKGNEVFISSLEGPLLATLLPGKNQYGFSDYGSIATIGSSYVYNIFKDSKGRVWFASFGKGLTMLQNGQYKTFNKAQGLPSDIVYGVTEDKKGDIWFSTGDAGICRYDGTKFTTYGMAQGLSNLEISGIKTDALGRIVVAHKTGLNILDPQTNTIGYIGGALGINQVNTDDLGCLVQGADGAIFFSTPSGVAKYQAVPDLALKPITMIESVKLLLEEIGPGPHSAFKYDEDNFTFHFNGLYYSDPEQVQYQYRLVGLNNDWVSTKNTDAPFPKLPPGKYTFRVRSSLNGNFSNAMEAQYSFVIKQPFWKTWWFIILSVLVATALLFWYIKSRETNLKNVERLRQEKIQFQFEVLRNQVNPHFLFNSFNTLITIIEENPKAAVDYVEQLSDFFRNIVNYRDKDVIALEEEIDLLQTYYYLQQQRYGNSLQLTINLSAKEASEIFIPPLTLQLLMENAVKHNAVSKESLLNIAISVNAQGYVVVQNNINPTLRKAVGAGMGLQNIVNRYGLLSHKQVQINNTGKEFIVQLPILKK
jgi:ligand-binding sensor domain-containing protein